MIQPLSFFVKKRYNKKIMGQYAHRMGLKRDIIRREFKRKVRKEIYEDEYDERIF